MSTATEVLPHDCPCGVSDWVEAWTYDAPPAGETGFPALHGLPYRRTVWACRGCGHYGSRPPLDPEALYRDAYVDATYGPRGLRAAFDRVMALPHDRSDNRGRVVRVTDWCARLGVAGRRALDVGSGLAVFPAALAVQGWEVTALDPDPRAVAHARTVAGVAAVCGDLETVDPGGRFDLVTINKVLEHVADPATMLRRALGRVAAGGLLYLEVPDGVAAAAEGPGREEFFIEHLHAFSARSLLALAAAVGAAPAAIEAVHEPSGKWTLAAALTPPR